MTQTKKRLLFWFTLFVLPASHLFAQSVDHSGREFFFAFLPNPIEPITLQLHLQAETGANVLVEYPVGTPLGDSLHIGAGESMIVTIPANAGRLSSWPGHFSLESDRNAIRVAATSDITCTLLSRNDASSDGGLALPTEALQQNYIVAGYDIGDQTDQDAGVFAVVAPHDSTLVTITPVQALTGGAPAAQPFRIVLERGEAFLAESAFDVFGPDVSLAGSFVKASKPVSVINGNKCTRVPFGNPSCDHLFEVAPPIQTWGKQVLVSALGEASIRPAGASYRILAAAPNTTVFLDGNPIATLDENQFFNIDTLAGAHVFSADQPIFVTQFMTSKVSAASRSADPAMVNMIPTEQFVDAYAFSIPTDAQNLPLFENNLITAIVDDDDIGSFTLDGVAVAAQEFTAIQNSGYAVATVEFNGEISHRTRSPNGHSVLVWGFSNDNSYIFPAGTRLEPINPLDDTPPDISFAFDKSTPATAFGAVFDSKSGNIAGRDTLLYGGERSGIASIVLADSQNVELRELTFNRGGENGTFTLELSDRSAAGMATVDATDLGGNRTSADIFLPALSLKITEPADQLITTNEQVAVKARTIFTTLGGDDLSHYQKFDTLFVNDGIFTGAALASDDTSITATVPLDFGANRIIAKRLLRHEERDSDASKPVTFAADTVFVARAAIFSCEALRFISPTDSAAVHNERVAVSFENSISGGVPPAVRSIALANLTTQQTISVRDTLQATPLTDTTTVEVPLTEGWNRIVATLFFSDSINQTSTCSDTIDLFQPADLLCQLAVESPADSAFLAIGNSQFRARFSFSGGVQPYADTTGYFIIDGDTISAMLHADSTMTAEVPLHVGENNVVAVVRVTDGTGRQSECTQTLTVFGVEELQCSATITNLSDGDFINEDSLRIKAAVMLSGGVLPVVQQSVRLIVNQDTTVFTRFGDRTFSLVRPALDGANTIELLATFVDAIGQETTCGQRIEVTKDELFSCAVQILSPQQGAMLTADSVDVIAVTQASGGQPPFTASHSISSIPVVAQNDTIMLRIPLQFGDNPIVVSSTYQDQAGQKTTCGAGVNVTRVEGPLCEITIHEPADGAILTGDSVLVRATRTIDGGMPPFREMHSINGTAVEVLDDTLQLRLPIFVGENAISVSSTITDSAGHQTRCEKMVTVLKPGAPTCDLTVIEPADGSQIASDSVLVEAIIEIREGVPPYQVSASIDGVPAVLHGDTLTARVPLAVGSNAIIISSTLTDSAGQQATCSAEITVNRPNIPICNVTLAQPEDGFITTNDSLLFRARATVSAGVLPYADSLFAFLVNADTFRVAEPVDTLFSANLPLADGSNLVTALFRATDAAGQIATCSATITVFRAEPMACDVQILTPQDGEIVIRDSVRVTAVASVAGGISPVLQRGAINDTPATQQGDTLTATVAVTLGENPIEVSAVFADLDGDSVVCSQAITVVKEAFSARVQILSPQDSSFSCEDSVVVVAALQVTGGVAPLQSRFELNGTEVEAVNDSITGTLVLQSGWIDIVVEAAITDALGRSITVFDTVTVLRDDMPPQCDFHPENGDVVGTFTDTGSGIASFAIRDIENGRLFVEPFEPGDNVAHFRVERIRSHKSLVFNIFVTDMCGNQFLCDPVYLSLEADAARELEFTFPSIDRYLYLTNNGLEEIQFDLNGTEFTVATHASASDAQQNRYIIPVRGRLALDLAPCLRDDGNSMSVTFSGPAGASADLLLMDVDTGVDEVLDCAEAPPITFRLLQNHPNPFNPETVIPIEIPASWPHPVKLQIYNATGRLIKTLHDDYMSAGHNTLVWDGTDVSGKTVASGVYLYRATSGEVALLKKLLLIR